MRETFRPGYHLIKAPFRAHGRERDSCPRPTSQPSDDIFSPYTPPHTHSQH